MTILVREARADDASAVAELHIHGWKAYRDLLPDEVIDDEAADQGCHERWHRQLARPAEERATRVWVAEEATDPRRILGFVSAGPCADPGEDDSDEIWDLWVHPAHRSGGVGHTLLTHALAQSRRPCVVWVLAANARGRSFYAREGAVDDRVQRAWRFDEHVGVEIVDIRMRWVA